MATGAQQIKAGEAFLTLRVNDGEFRRGLDRSIGKLNQFGNSLKRIGSLGIAGGGLAGIQRAIGLLAGSAILAGPIKLAAELEQVEAAFTALTGSAEKARDIVAELLKFSGKTSFGFETLTGAARNLLNFGVAAEQVLPLLQQLSAIAAGDADRLDRLAIAFGQTQAKGRLMAEEVRQMVNAGFNPLQEIARTTGRSMGELLKAMEANKISAQDVTKAFESAVGPGGRFAGILDLIQKTAIGQFRKLAAGIKLAVIPLGKELLPAITGVLKYINNLIPSISQVIRQNASWYKVIIATALGLSGLLAALFSLGVTFNVVAFAASGLVGALGLILNPITLIGAAMAGLATIFVQFTNLGGAAFGFLASKFGQLADVAVQTFEGIADALSGGDIVAAANVLWAGLNLAWVKGTAELERIWIDYKFFFLENTTEIVFSALDLWNEFSARLKSIWTELVTEAKTIGERIGNALTRSTDDPELAADQDAASNQAIGIIQAEGQARQQQIQDELEARRRANDEARRIAEETRKSGLAGDIAAAEQKKREAQAAFEAARQAAIRARPPGGGGFEAKFNAALGNIDATATAANFSRSTFSGKLAPQIFGAGGETTLKQIAKNTGKTVQVLDGIANNAFKNVRKFRFGDK